MARTGAELITEVQALSGRTGDTVLVTTARVLVWLNEAQKDIAENAPCLHELAYKNTTSLDVTATLKWSLADITFDFTYDNTTSTHIAHTFATYYLDGNNSKKLTYIPVDEFDEIWPDPTNSDTPTSLCNVWTRRGNYIEIMPLCDTGYHDDDWRFDVGIYPRDFTGTASTTASDLRDADNILIAYGLWKAFTAIGVEKAADAAMWKTEYYQQLEDYKDKSETMHEWDGNWYSPAE